MSDHFDGKRFFNPHWKQNHNFWQLLKFLTSSQYENWPKEVPNNPKYDFYLSLEGNQVAITFVGHATALIQVKGANILTDPVWSERASPFQNLGPKRARAPGVAIEELPPIDYVLISHNHYDHLDLETLKILKQRFDPQFLISLGDKKLLNRHGIDKIEELDWWEGRTFANDLSFTFTPTQHFSSRGPFDRNKSLWGSFMIEAQGKLIYFGGDAGYSPHYKEIFERFGACDLALLPIGAYEPRWFMKPVHMNPEEAVMAHRDLKSKQSVGIHFGTFQLTTEAIDAPVKELKEALLRHGLDEKAFVTLREGVTTLF